MDPTPTSSSRTCAAWLSARGSPSRRRAGPRDRVPSFLGALTPLEGLALKARLHGVEVHMCMYTRVHSLIVYSRVRWPSLLRTYFVCLGHRQRVLSPINLSACRHTESAIFSTLAYGAFSLAVPSIPLDSALPHLYCGNTTLQRLRPSSGACIGAPSSPGPFNARSSPLRLWPRWSSRCSEVHVQSGSLHTHHPLPAEMVPGALRESERNAGGTDIKRPTREIRVIAFTAMLHEVLVACNHTRNEKVKVDECSPSGR